MEFNGRQLNSHGSWIISSRDYISTPWDINEIRLMPWLARSCNYCRFSSIQLTGNQWCINLCSRWIKWQWSWKRWFSSKRCQENQWYGCIQYYCNLIHLCLYLGIHCSLRSKCEYSWSLDHFRIFLRSYWFGLWSW